MSFSVWTTFKIDFRGEIRCKHLPSNKLNIPFSHRLELVPIISPV